MFETLLMQVTQQPATALESITAIIMAIAAIAGVIGHFMLTTDRFKKYGQYATTFSQKTVEQEANIKSMGQAFASISPEAAAALEKYGIPLAELAHRLEAAEAQLNVLQSNIPKSYQADLMKSLPR